MSSAKSSDVSVKHRKLVGNAHQSDERCRAYHARGVDLSYCTDAGEASFPSMMAVVNLDWLDGAQVLRELGVDPNTPLGETGNTVPYDAASLGKTESIQVFVELGTDVREDRTPVYQAAAFGHFKTIRVCMRKNMFCFGGHTQSPAQKFGSAATDQPVFTILRAAQLPCNLPACLSH